MRRNPKEIFGHNLRRIRHEAGLSQEELGFRAKLHRTYISSIERGERNVAALNLIICDPSANNSMRGKARRMAASLPLPFFRLFPRGTLPPRDPGVLAS